MSVWSSTPVLPLAELGPLWVSASWGLVAAALCWLLSVRWQRPWLRGVALLCGVSALWPWGGNWTAWLALAVQTPSLMTLGWLLMRVWQVTRQPTAPAPTVPLSLAGLGVVAGWGLWLDTLNLWPADWDLSLFAWGFTAWALWTAWACVALACWRGMGRASASQPVWTLLCGVLLGFACTRWPSGNLWDALLDPWIWIGCHAVLLRAVWRVCRRGPQR